jgi:hypothetical protein
VIFERLSAGGCQSYLIGCSDSCAAVVIDPEISLVDRYTAMAARDGLRIHGRTDLPTGDPDALHDSLFNRVLQLDPEMTVHPAHEYKGRALDGGMKAWREAGYPIRPGREP